MQFPAVSLASLPHRPVSLRTFGIGVVSFIKEYSF